MKHFENAIREYLDARAKEDVKFAEKYSDKKKSIGECCWFILGEIRKLAKGGCYGATDSEVYGLAVHYYDEPDIKVDGEVSAEVVINRELTKEEKAAARESKKGRKSRCEKKGQKIMKKADDKRKAKEKRRKEEEEGLLFLFDDEEL